MSNPLKRQHTDGGGKGPRFEGEQDPGACTPDGDVWFSDGNIDIVAEGTSFRVHRGILSVHSELFRDMLSMPQPGGPESVSCPVIEVSDSSSDMRHLLLAIYNCHPCFAPHLTARSELVLRLVRLAHKYQVKRIIDDAMSRLKTLYPDGFGVFLEMLNKPPNSTLSGHQDMGCLDVIQLAKLVGSQSLLHDSDRLQHSCSSRRELSRSFDSPTNESTAWVNDQEAWFWDGNIDIVAGNIRFRVHRSVLSAHSELFHDMLSIPQPENGGAQEQDRCPIVEVTDSADDMRHLLLTLYNRNKYFEAHVQPKFGVVCSIARLAHKYQVRGVLDDAMRRVKSIYVDNVPDLLDAINGTASTTSSCPGYRDSLRVLELSRLLGDTSPLRSAYYYLAQTLPHDLQLNETSEDILLDFADEVSRVITGRRELAEQTLNVRRAAVQSGAFECYENICEEGRAEARRTLDHDDGWTDCDAFTRTDMDEYGGYICQACVVRMKRNEYRAMREVWHQLPDIFRFHYND